MFDFAVNGEKVVGAEYTGMQTRDFLKQQVRIVSEVVSEAKPTVPTSKLNKFAKQILRVLATCSLISMAEGGSVAEKLVSCGNSWKGDTIGALGHWLPELSPMTVMIFVFAFILLTACMVFMIPGGRDPETADQNQPEGEPASDPLTSRYPLNERALGHLFPSVFADRMFRVEGVIIWMYSRCEGRVNRGNKRVLNGFRMETLQQMMRVCIEGMTREQSRNMRDNIVAMSNLSDDEGFRRISDTW